VRHAAGQRESEDCPGEAAFKVPEQDEWGCNALHEGWPAVLLMAHDRYRADVTADADYLILVEGSACQSRPDVPGQECRMTFFSPVSAATRERISREFDERGPQACLAEVIEDLRRNNPQLLGIARSCAASLDDQPRIMLGFGMFYRLLIAPSVPVGATSGVSPLPCVTRETCDVVVNEIDRDGTEAFTMRIVNDLEANNPELLQMAHNFASRQSDYLGVIQGLALFYKSIVEESKAVRSRPH
jgi:hypothetical protein